MPGLAWGEESRVGGAAGRTESDGSQAAEREAARWSALAFRTIERAKARGLLDMLGASALGAVSSAEEALLDSLYALDTACPTTPAANAGSRTSMPRFARAPGLVRRRPPGAGDSRTDEIRKSLPRWDRDARVCSRRHYVACLAHRPRRAMTHTRCQARDLEEAVARLRDAIARPMPADDALRANGARAVRGLVPSREDRLKKAKYLGDRARRSSLRTSV